MKTLRATDAMALASLALTTVFTAILFPALPQRMATHFDAYGNPNDWTDVRVGAWLMPGVGLAIWALIRFSDRLTRNEAKRKAVREAPMSLLGLVLALFMSAAQLLLLAFALGKIASLNGAMCAILGLL